jgi:uncharacterized protein
VQKVELARTIDTVAPDEWDALSGDRPFAGHRWLRLAESVIAGYRPRYLLVRRYGRLVAAAMGTLEGRLQNPVLDTRFGWLLRRSPFLSISMPLTSTCGLLVADAGNQQTELATLLRAIRTVTRKERYRFSVIDHLAPEHPAVAAAQRSHCRLALPPEVHLDLRWSTFDDYLSELPRKKRHEIRRTQRRSEREGIVVEPLVPTAEQAPTLDRLVAGLVRRHGGTRQFQPDLFGTAAAVLGDDLTVLAAHRNGRLVGCVALLRCGEVIDARWIGRDYERTAGTAVHHALLTACVRTAVSTDARRLRLGATAYRTKQHYGVTVEPRTRLFAARNPAVTRLVDRLGHRFEPQGLPSGLPR